MLSSEDDDTFVQSSPWPLPWSLTRTMTNVQNHDIRAVLHSCNVVRVLFNASQRVSIPGGGWSAQGEKSNQRKLIKTRPATYYTQCYSFSAALCSKWIRKLITQNEYKNSPHTVSVRCIFCTNYSERIDAIHLFNVHEGEVQVIKCICICICICICNCIYICAQACKL